MKRGKVGGVREIASNVMLSHPDDTKQYIIGADALDFGLGAWIAQKHGNELRTLSFASRSLSKPERNYSATKKELLAIVWAIDRFKNYIGGHKFVVHSDHQALTHLFTQPISTT